MIPQASPNAFATGRNPKHAAVAATEGILRILSEGELEGVIAHELAHVKHRDILISSIAATIGATIMMVSRFAMFFGGGRDNDRGGNPIALLATMILAPHCRDADSGGDLALAGVPRGRRRRCPHGQSSRSGQRPAKNRGAARAVPLDANPATAHMFIIKPFSAGGLMGLFSTHPPTEARVQALLNPVNT